MKSLNLDGLITATHTPFSPDGSLHLAAVEQQAKHLLQHHIRTVFIGGSTGECHSLSLEERRQLARRWMDVSRGTPLRVIVHVGSNCLRDAAALARHAQDAGAAAVSAFSPSYFKPGTVDRLLDCTLEIASAAPEMPFYFYDIPALTGVALPMPEFMERARARLPSFAGIKYTNPDLIALQECLHLAGNSLDIFWGSDECLLAALAMGVKGAVGSTYNFAAPVAQQLIQAFHDRDLETARAAQFRLVQVVRLLSNYGYLGASKLLLQWLGVELGPVRLPLPQLAPEQGVRLRGELEELGFFGWISSGPLPGRGS